MASDIASHAKSYLNGSIEQLNNTTNSNNTTGLHQGQYMGLSFFLAVLVPCFPYRSPLRWGILALQLTALVQAYLARPPPMPSTPELYTFGVLLGNLTFRYLDRIYLHVPEKAFWRINKDGSAEDANKLSFFKKWIWSLELLIATRGIGWNWRVGGIPHMKEMSRAKFLVKALSKWVAMYAALYVTSVTCAMLLDGFSNVQDPELQRMLVSITTNDVFLYFFIMLASAPTIYSHFASMMHPASIVSVGLQIGPAGWEKPSSWPSNFGHISEAWSIRRFWG